jgi:hypothetical protein
VFRQRRSQREHDLERELRSDLELEMEEQAERGLSPADARSAAQQAFGNTAFLKEEVREMWGWTWIERFWPDLRYATRMFVRNPGFVTVAAVSLALGIGANAAMFALVNSLLIRPLPYAESTGWCGSREFIRRRGWRCSRKRAAEWISRPPLRVPNSI